MDSNEEKTLLRNNPLFVIGIASLLAIAMFSVSFIIYYRSDTKKTIEQIQENNLQSASDDSSSDALPAELNDVYLDSLETQIKEQIAEHPDDTEFSADELTDSALGL